MSYVHCHSCGWDNDDFLEDYGGNKGYIKNFIKPSIKEIIKPDNKCKNPISRKRMFKRLIAEIKKLYWLNFKQEYGTFKNYSKVNPEHICPKCGKNELDVD